MATALTGCTCSQTMQQLTDTPATEITTANIADAEPETDISFDAGSITLDLDYAFFGEIGYRARAFAEDTLKFPPISGLVHKSVLVTCPIDTCFTEYATLALRGPKVPALLNWVSEQAKLFADECPIGNRCLGATGKEKDYDALTALMIPRLKNRSRNFVGPGYTYSEEDKWFLEQISGIGLIKEGLIITFYPYVISGGADGHFHAVIPYEDLKGILKI